MYKQFDLERAKAGDPVVYRDSTSTYPARIVCFDRNYKNRPILALVMMSQNNEVAYSCSDCGIDTGGYMLLMAPVTKQEWRNGYRDDDDNIVLRGDSHPDPLTCRKAAYQLDPSHVGPVLIREWEE